MGWRGGWVEGGGGGMQASGEGVRVEMSWGKGLVGVGSLVEIY